MKTNEIEMLWILSVCTSQKKKKKTEREGGRKRENVSHVGEALSNILSLLCQLTEFKEDSTMLNKSWKPLKRPWGTEEKRQEQKNSLTLF